MGPERQRPAFPGVAEVTNQIKNESQGYVDRYDLSEVEQIPFVIDVGNEMPNNFSNSTHEVLVFFKDPGKPDKAFAAYTGKGLDCLASFVFDGIYPKGEAFVVRRKKAKDAKEG